MTSTTTVSGHIESLQNREKNGSKFWEIEVGDKVYREPGTYPEELEEGLEVEMEVNDSDDFGDIEDYNLVYDKQDAGDEEAGDVPIFQNDSVGVAAWINKDKNGDFYLRVKASFVGSFNIFVNDDGHKEAFNRFCEEVKQ